MAEHFGWTLEHKSILHVNSNVIDHGIRMNFLPYFVNRLRKKILCWYNSCVENTLSYTIKKISLKFNFSFLLIMSHPQSGKALSYTTLQIKGRWESNINVWFRFIYSQKWNCAASLFTKQNYNVLYPSFHIHVSVCDLYVPGSVCLFAAAK